MSKKLFGLLVLVVLVLTLLPAAAVAAPSLQGGETYTIQADDWLSKIAEKQYGDPLAYSAIVYYNNLQAAEDETINVIEDPNSVEVGWTIFLPSPEEATAFMIGNVPGGKYNEAPMLAEMVASGALPPVDQRLPSNPLIENVAEEIGQYGGILRRGFLGPSDANNYVRVMFDALVRYSPDGGEVIPHIAAGWEASPDFTTWTLRLRPGARWSDGAPFTADDIMFWYEDIYLNKELTPVPHPWLVNEDGSVATVEKLSDYSVQYTFKQPNTAFLQELANKDGGDRLLAAFQRPTT